MLRRPLLLLTASAALIGCQPDALAPSQDPLVQDDKPMDYASASEALRDLPNRRGIKSIRVLAPGITQYSSGVSELTTWYAFGNGSYAYPTVVRRRVVGSPEKFVVKTTILCGAPAETCARVRAQVAQMRQK